MEGYEGFSEIRRVKEQYEAALMERLNVVGVGIGFSEVAHRKTDEVSILVLVRQKLALTALPRNAVVPKEMNGVRTDVIQVGEIRARQAPTDRWRPAPGGVSIGHYRITAGTFGGVVTDRASGARLILSNNHVLANSNDASPGDAIIQPGAADGGSASSDVIARLERFCPIDFNLAPPTCGVANMVVLLGNLAASLAGSSHRLLAYQTQPRAVNQVDAAVARPLDDSLIRNDILEIGEVTGTTPPALGMQVQKSGRTTGHTTGEITVLDTTIDVSYGQGRTARFEHQFLSGPMSQGGDSGSLLVGVAAPLAVGLLFAGSDQTTVYNPIQAVLDCLNVNIGAVQPVAQPAAYSGAQPAFASGAQSTPRDALQPSAEQAQVVKEAHESELLSKPNVVGVGVGRVKKGGVPTGQTGLVVLVRQKQPLQQLAPQEAIPSEIDGVPVDVEEVGEIRAQ
jgi:hypothetical protein